ncbi:MAG TPA: putative baseplate assembly protein [Opitutaceae bacterium]|nr:putative baseplate assembly protein [Opitutaceae bacterium]
MNGDCQTSDKMCGCCQGITEHTPQPITNRPRLPAIAYRVGLQPEFKASMLGLLSDPQWPALSGLRTRLDTDFSIALLDAWATVSDILSFYQERIANELYLRTAVDQRSVFDLAALVGYKPAPGAAASAYIAFTLNNAPGSPESVLIAAGSRVQSVPGPGQKPQVFETSADLQALIEYNAIPAQTTLPWSFNPGDTSMWLAGTANNLQVGDSILFVCISSDPTQQFADFHFITAVTVDATSGNTYVAWDQGLSSAISGTNVAVYAFRKKGLIYGAQSPDPRTLSTNIPIMKAPDYTGGPDWNFALDNFGSNSNQICLDATYAGLAPDASGDPQWLVFLYKNEPVLYQITAADELAPMHFTVTTKTTRVTLANEQRLYDLPRVVSPAPTSLLSEIVGHTRSEAVYVQSSELTPADPPYIETWAFDSTYNRQAGLLVPVEGNTLSIADVQELNVGQAVGVFGQRLRLQALTANSSGFVPEGASAGQQVTQGQVFIIAAFPPTAKEWQVITTSGVAGTLQNTGGFLLVPADPKDPVVSEAMILTSAAPNGPATLLTFEQTLANIYDRSTVTVNANVALATNGQTVNEILGNGDATNAGLQFTLKQKPLTYLSSSTGLGVASTLQVWVNNLQWHEVGNFLSSDPSDRVFTTVMNEDGTVTVQFGDGVNGARTPTGQMNIRAVYRVGIGLGGMVQAGQLTLPLDRPQGLKSSINPAPATGASDPDTAETARTSAPLHVLTLDRVVSLEDYQNYCLVFGGIAKALATLTWFGDVQGVFLTVAGPEGAEIESPTTDNLIAALHNIGNPYVPIFVQTYTPRLFELGANIQIDTNDYDPKLVLAQVWTSLTAAFSFDERDFGQGVAQSEVIAVIQQVPGVIGVEITTFYRSDLGPSTPLPTVLRAASPLPGPEGIMLAAELLTLDPACQGLIVQSS